MFQGIYTLQASLALEQAEHAKTKATLATTLEALDAEVVEHNKTKMALEESDTNYRNSVRAVHTYMTEVHEQTDEIEELKKNLIACQNALVLAEEARKDAEEFAMLF